MNWYKESQEKYDHIPEENKGGDCFTQAFNYIFEEGVMKGRDDLILVHAIIRPLMGPLAGVQFGHAWVEDGDTVIDTSRNQETYKKWDYYLLGGLVNMPTADSFQSGKPEITFKEENIHRYTVRDAKRLAVQHGYYGPWKEEFSDFVLENKEDEHGSDQY